MHGDEAPIGGGMANDKQPKEVLVRVTRRNGVLRYKVEDGPLKFSISEGDVSTTPEQTAATVATKMKTAWAKLPWRVIDEAGQTLWKTPPRAAARVRVRVIG